MGLVRAALIFGAGYALGRPEGRQKIAELARHPEADRLRQQAVDTVSTGLETGKKRLADTRSGSGEGAWKLPSPVRRNAPTTYPDDTTATTDPAVPADPSSMPPLPPTPTT